LNSPPKFDHFLDIVYYFHDYWPFWSLRSDFRLDLAWLWLVLESEMWYCKRCASATKVRPLWCQFTKNLRQNGLIRLRLVPFRIEQM
jgi:hypothetical protein